MVKIVVTCIVVVMLAVSFAEAATEDKVVMNIEGMTCSLCTVAVKKTLSKVEGVHMVEVSLEEKQAQVTVDETVQDDTLVNAVKKAGYKGKIITREPVADTPEA